MIVTTSGSRNARASSISARAFEISFRLQGTPSATKVSAWTRRAVARSRRRAVVLVGHDARSPDYVAIKDENLEGCDGAHNRRVAEKKGRITSFRNAVGGGE
jgi:hypothetical protein